METSTRSQSASRGRLIAILFGLVAATLLCANVVVAALLFRFPEPDRPAAEQLGQVFENRPYGIRLRLPESWVYSDAVPGLETFVMQFASSERALKELPSSPKNDVGILVLSGNETVDELFPAGTNIREMNELTAASQFSIFSPLQDPHRLDLTNPDYDASAGLYLFRLDDGQRFLNSSGRNKIALLAVIRRGEDLIRFVAVCRPDDWLEHGPTLEAILQSLEVSARQK